MTKDQKGEIEWAIAALEAALKTFWQADAAAEPAREGKPAEEET